MQESAPETFLHGGDYYPEQWLNRPDVLEEDLRLMKKAKCNIVSLGIFSWDKMEPVENEYDFSWLSGIIERLWKNGISVFLATPSAARPAWMSQKYPEILRVGEDGIRVTHGSRANFCPSSPIYRQKVMAIDKKLSDTFAAHPAVKGWHISNEYVSECYCPLCQQAFREWLKAKYKTLDALNNAWWTGFWAKTYTDWQQLSAPTSHGEFALQGLTLDWKRFSSEQMLNFMRMEKECLALKPVTTNMMEDYPGIDYFRFASSIDFASLDSYPDWGKSCNLRTALDAGFQYDLIRSILGKPWVLMESTPSQVNWRSVSRLKPPGLHKAASLLAVSHGSDAVMYFQWRKSRGGNEKLHGAVIDHSGSEDTRVYREVCDVGEALSHLTPMFGQATNAPAAVLYDWDNRWALEADQGPRLQKDYPETVKEHYRALSAQHINCDVIDQLKPFDGYRLLSAPMPYLLKPGVARRLQDFVENGGVLVLTYMSGWMDENDLCFKDGLHTPLEELTGVHVEETDALHPGQQNKICFLPGNALGISGTYSCNFLCELVKPVTAVSQAVYGQDFYANAPAVTIKKIGRGTVIYLAARAEEKLLIKLYESAVRLSGIAPLATASPGVIVKSRGDYLTAINFAEENGWVKAAPGVDLLRGKPLQGKILLAPFEAIVLHLQPKQ